MSRLGINTFLPAHALDRVRRELAVVVVVGLVFAACSSDGSENPDAETVGSNGQTVDVIALDNSFRPETVEVAAGTAIRWENRGRNDHNVLPTDDTETWGAPTEAFLPGDEYTWIFSEPGTYAYYCSIHGTKDAGMIGAVVVTPAN